MDHHLPLNNVLHSGDTDSAFSAMPIKMKRLFPTMNETQTPPLLPSSVTITRQFVVYQSAGESKKREVELGSHKWMVCLAADLIVQELCESRGGRPELSVLTSLLVSVDVNLFSYIEPCFSIGLSLSLICQLTSEDIKQHYLPTDLFLNSCFLDTVSMSLLRTAVETAISGVHKLLRTNRVLTSVTLLFWRWLTVSSVFAGRSARTSSHRYPILLKLDVNNSGGKKKKKKIASILYQFFGGLSSTLIA